jgi:hypothetical protein
MSKYIYFITENEDSNFFSTSFEEVRVNGERYFDIYNFNNNFDFNLLRYVSVDETQTNTFLKYANSRGIGFFLVELVSIDSDRSTVRIKIIREESNMDLQQYKREIRIEKLLE